MFLFSVTPPIPVLAFSDLSNRNTALMMDHDPQVQWRVALYVVGDLNNAICLLDAFFKTLADALAKEKSFDVHLTPHTGIDVEDVSPMSILHVTATALRRLWMISSTRT